jgi:anti-sigma-K factor RskA
MEIDKYISSGILELYVAGLLTEEQNMEVQRRAQENPRIMEEILAIEGAVRELSKSVSPRATMGRGFPEILKRIGEEVEPVELGKPRRGTSWTAYSGWAAAILLAAGIWWVYQQNQDLQTQMELRSDQIEVLEDQIFQARSSREKSETLLNALRGQNVTVVALGGQATSPDSFAKAYWNKSENKVYIDALGLPEPPPGKVYQVWSLKLSPLAPTSIGLLEDFMSDENKIFALLNPNDSEAFGITLEPAGGSETPTMDQLYTLGQVAS